MHRQTRKSNMKKASRGIDIVRSRAKRTRPRPAARPRSVRPRITSEIEQEILLYAVKDPCAGQDRVAREMQAKKMFVSPSGVRYVWQRHNLETLAKRVAALERNHTSTSQDWTSTQLAARERIRSDRNTRRIASRVMGAAADDFSRGDYILAIAAQVFNEQGYDAASLREIAERAGIPVGSLYYHFPSKEVLFESVHKEGMRRLSELVKSAISLSKSPIERLNAACAAHLRPMCAGDKFTTAAIPTRVPDVSATVRNSIEALNARYEGIFKRLVEDLTLPAEVDPSILRLQILGALNWTITWYKAGKATPDEIATNLINALRLPLSADN